MLDDLRRLVVVAAAAMPGCLAPSSQVCPSVVCPAPLRCAEQGEAVCVAPTCGNGRLDPGESCDDGNNASGDQCPADCAPDSPVVTGGMFLRGYDTASDLVYTRMDLPATISTFRLDKYEVTVARFRRFVASGMGTQASPPAPGAGAHPRIPGTGWDAAWNDLLVRDSAILRSKLAGDPLATWTDASGANDRRPINDITWYEAMAFCIWDGGFLPTQAEWNYAAAGGDEQRAYPWSNPPGDLTITTSHASYGELALNGVGENRCFGDGDPRCTVADLIEVGSKPAGDGRWGQSDLAGNVSEWTLDYYSPAPLLPCVDCANTTPEAYRTLGSGSFGFPPRSQRANAYEAGPPTLATASIGVRCARPAL